MLEKMMNKLRVRRSTSESADVSEDFHVADISAYQKVALEKRGSGYKGLKDAMDKRSKVRLKVASDDDIQYVEGIVSHYDEEYSQLVVVSGTTLRRLVFDEIGDVEIL